MLGRPLTDEEREEVLRAMGHPLVVAARYRKEPQMLIGPELFPYWLFAVKAGLLIMAAVFALTLMLRLAGNPLDAGQAVAQSFHGLFGAGLTLIGAVTPGGRDLRTLRASAALSRHLAGQGPRAAEVRRSGALGLASRHRRGRAGAGRGPRHRRGLTGRRRTRGGVDGAGSGGA